MSRIILCACVALLAVLNTPQLFAQTINPQSPQKATPQPQENPFDFIREQLSPSAFDPSLVERVERDPVVRPNPVPAEIAEDPASIPTGTHHHRNTMVDRMAQQQTVASVPHASNAVIEWGLRHPHPPIYIAPMMLRQDCVEGLWCGYGAIRAEACAKQWERLSAQRCRKCKTGDSTGYHNFVVNRYTAGCDSGAQPATTAAKPEVVRTGSVKRPNIK